MSDEQFDYPLKCNYCTLQDIKERHGKEKVFFRMSTGKMEGWVEVNVEGKDEPAAYFMELTDHCVC